jgi:hypothetical protein
MDGGDEPLPRFGPILHKEVGMQSVSDRPEKSQSFGSDEDERDSEVHVKVAPRTPDMLALDTPASETRIATRPRTHAALTDDEWAEQTMGEPVVVLSPDEMRRLPLDHRAGYLMSLMDGSMDLETVLDVSALPRQEALAVVRGLFEFGAIKFR